MVLGEGEGEEGEDGEEGEFEESHGVDSLFFCKGMEVEDSEEQTWQGRKSREDEGWCFIKYGSSMCRVHVDVSQGRNHHAQAN